jgi:hypothetical protein
MFDGAGSIGTLATNSTRLYWSNGAKEIWSVPK